VDQSTWVWFISQWAFPVSKGLCWYSLRDAVRDGFCKVLGALLCLMQNPSTAGQELAELTMWLAAGSIWGVLMHEPEQHESSQAGRIRQYRTVLTAVIPSHLMLFEQKPQCCCCLARATAVLP
jgi:hypothetical protein